MPVMPEKAPRWARPAAVWWEGSAGGGKDESSKLRSNKPPNSNNRGSCRHINVLLAPVWTREATV